MITLLMALLRWIGRKTRRLRFIILLVHLVDMRVDWVVDDDNVLCDVLNCAVVNYLLGLLIVLVIWLVELVVTTIPLEIRVTGRRLVSLDNTIIICPAWRSHVVVLREHA